MFIFLWPYSNPSPSSLFLKEINLCSCMFPLGTIMPSAKRANKSFLSAQYTHMSGHSTTLTWLSYHSLQGLWWRKGLFVKFIKIYILKIVDICRYNPYDTSYSLWRNKYNVNLCRARDSVFSFPLEWLLSVWLKENYVTRCNCVWGSAVKAR